MTDTIAHSDVVFMLQSLAPHYQTAVNWTIDPVVSRDRRRMRRLARDTGVKFSRTVDGWYIWPRPNVSVT